MARPRKPTIDDKQVKEPVCISKEGSTSLRKVVDIVSLGSDEVTKELLAESGTLALHALRDLQGYTTLDEAKNAATTAKILIDIYKSMVALEAGVFKESEITYEY